jgi:hypothetical protein
MIIHALSIQFIVNLDNELKDYYMKSTSSTTNQATVNLFKSKQYCRDNSSASVAARGMVVLSKTLGLLAVVSTPILLFAAMPILTYCKGN